MTTKTTGRQHSNPHGTFYSSVTQAIANIANVQAVAFEKHSDVHGFTHSTTVNNSRIYVPYTGSYEVIFSGIADLAAAPANKHLEIWLAIDGSPVADSNTRTEIQSATIEMTVAVAIDFDMTAGHYFELITWGDSTNCRWLATAAAAGPTRPACPSVIAVAKMINAY